MQRRGLVLWGALVLVVGVAVGVLGQTHASADPSARCAAIARKSVARAALVTGSGPTVAVIGDSYAMGTGLADPVESWPSYLPGSVHVDGFAGSGFTRAASPCAGVVYADRIQRALSLHPSLVVVEGGLNDWRSPTASIESGARAVLDQLHDVQVVLVGPADAPARADQVERVDAALATVAAEQDVLYVSAKDWSLSFLADRLHPTAAAHQDFGLWVAAELRERLSGLPGRPSVDD